MGRQLPLPSSFPKSWGWLDECIWLLPSIGVAVLNMHFVPKGDSTVEEVQLVYRSMQHPLSPSEAFDEGDGPNSLAVAVQLPDLELLCTFPIVGTRLPARWSSFTSSLVPSQWTQRALRPFFVQREEQELDTVHYTPTFSESLHRIHGETALEVPSLTSWPRRFGLLTKAWITDCERSWFEAPLWNSIAVTWRFDTHRGTDDPARLTIQGILQPAARTQVQADSARVGGWVLSPVGRVPVEWDHVVSSLRASMTLTSST